MTEVQVNSILNLNVERTISANEIENRTLPSMPLLFPISQPGSPVPATTTENTSESDPLPSTSPENEREMPSPEKPLSLSPVKDSSNDAAYDSISIEDCDELARGSHVQFGDKRKPSQFSHSSHPPPRKRKKQEIFELTEGMEEEPGNHYVEAYFSKAKSILDESMFQKFITILSEAKDEPGGSVALYKKVEELFINFPELTEDFIGTLRPDQALEIGKLLDLKFITRSLAFFKKLEGFQLTKVIHALETLVSNSHLSEELVKTTMLCILKGHGPLAESFLHLLPNEKPPPPSSLDDYEDITDAMLEEGDDGGWETARIPEHAERGCLSDCPCRCHATPSQPFCLECNIRFIKGQAYVQYGKVIRYCKVHFGDMAHDEVLQRFNPALYSKRRRKRKSISKTLIPPNESSKEVNEVIFQDENAVISKEDVQPSSSPGQVGDKVEEEDDYWEEDDVSSGDKSSGGDMFEELDRHSEDTEDRFIGQLNNPLSPLGSTVEGFYIKNGLPSVSAPDAVRGVVIDVSDIQPNGVNAHVFKFETRVSDDPCIKAPSTPEEVMVNEQSALQEASVMLDNCEILLDSQNGSSEAVVKAAINGFSSTEAPNDTLPVKMERNCDKVTVKSERPSCENSFTVAEDHLNPPDVPKVKTELDSESELLEKDKTDKPKESDKEWTRQEDKMILEAFQREIGSEETFARIRSLMPARTVDQIQERFQVLMNLLEKVASGSHDAHPN